MNVILRTALLVSWLHLSQMPVARSAYVQEANSGSIEADLRLQLVNHSKKQVRSSSPYDFPRFADVHGLNASRKALISLLADDEASVRCLAADVARSWLRPGDLDHPLLERCLESPERPVWRLAILIWPVDGTPTDAVLRLARDTANERNTAALLELPRFIQSGDKEAENILLEMTESSDVDAACLAISLLKEVPTVIPKSEPALRKALTRFEEGRLSKWFHTSPATLPPVSVQILREFGFADVATANSLRTYCKYQEEAYQKYCELKSMELNGGDAASLEPEHHNNGEPPFVADAWSDAAFALAIWQKDFESLRNILILRTSTSPPDDLEVSELNRLITDVIEDAPVTLTGWDHGLRVCRFLLATPEKRCESENWEALVKFPGAAYVFRPEMLRYLSELPEEAEESRTSASPGVLLVLAADGYSIADLEFSLRILRLEHRCRAASSESFEQLLSLVETNHYEREMELMLWSLINNADVSPSFIQRCLPPEAADGKVSRSRARILEWLEK
ncbi:MAG: hypothetical protein U0996_00470 [Planctomycetaceae bacterium]